jgi:hypothetical protein
MRVNGIDTCRQYFSGWEEERSSQRTRRAGRTKSERCVQAAELVCCLSSYTDAGMASEPQFNMSLPSLDHFKALSI